MASSQTALPVRKLDLSPPSLDDLAPAVLEGLKDNFDVVEVSVSACPDLREPPFHFAAEGLSGSPRIAEVGSPTNLEPAPLFNKQYDLLQVSELMDMSSTGALLGAGAGPYHALGFNSELMPNIAFHGDDVSNQTHYARVVESNKVIVQKIEISTGFAFMGNLFGSQGLPGPVLHVKAKSRTGKQNFTEAIQEGLNATFGDKLVSIGGLFLMKQGKMHVHVMADLPEKPWANREEFAKWLPFFDMESPLVCLSVFHSGKDQGFALRMEHTHCFSTDGSGRGGHYHYDLDETKGDVEYEGWFNVAEKLYRIDQPEGGTTLRKHP